MDSNGSSDPTAAAAVTATAVGETQPPSNNKVDPITALQDGIDGLSLAMFEALRGLRDAVAPESGNQANANNPDNIHNNTDETANDPKLEQQQQQQHPDAEELWQAYQLGDTSAKQWLDEAQSNLSTATTATTTNNNNNVNKQRFTRDEVFQIHAQWQQQRDTELVLQLAQTVLEKSEWIDRHVATGIPGLDRTLPQQLARMEQLMQQNETVLVKLRSLQQEATDKQEQCRTFVRDNTCRALDIVEEDTTATGLVAGGGGDGGDGNGNVIEQ